ncbi:MAG TPA: DNA repair protein RadA [Polyangiaceae bacterium]|nr:DNA repair protein RadA [Polyangiaceae bacterium]
MAKTSTQFVCQACGATSVKWLGKCLGCGGWNTFVEERVPAASPSSRAFLANAGPVLLGDIAADASARIATGIGELDRVLGGGAVLGAVVLVGGDPGVGKSTLLLQALSGLALRGVTALYVSGEESAGQTAQRARRLGVGPKNLMVLAEGDLAEVERAVREVRPKALVVDSVQTIRSDSLESAAGTVSQLREVTARLTDLSKREGIATFLVGHVTKEGQLAGPKVLEHLVDTVLSFEGERGHSFRALRTTKNRFGSATEVGVFEMTADGMREVLQPSALFLAERPRGASGSVVAATAEGARPLLVEVQALVGAPGFASPRRTANGVDGARLAMLLAVLSRRASVEVSSCDVFVNVAGGVRIDEPALDLAVALAVASSFRGHPFAEDAVAFGEVGLAGEVRGVARVAARLAEARAMGFRRALLPASSAERLTDAERGGLDLVPVSSLEKIIDLWL